MSGRRSAAGSDSAYMSWDHNTTPITPTIVISSRRPPATGHWPPATGHLLTGSPATGHLLTGSPATGHRPPATGHRPPATGHRPPTTGHRPPAHWPPAHWPRAHRYPPSAHRPRATGSLATGPLATGSLATGSPLPAIRSPATPRISRFLIDYHHRHRNTSQRPGTTSNRAPGNRTTTSPHASFMLS